MTGTPQGSPGHEFPVIRVFALTAVSIISVYVMVQGWRITDILAAPNWCNRAIGAAKEGDIRDFAVTGCFSLLKDQVAALALTNHIYAGVIALCLATIMILVVANGRARAKMPGGPEFDISSKDDTEAARAAAAVGATKTAEAAAEQADEFVDKATTSP